METRKKVSCFTLCAWDLPLATVALRFFFLFFFSFFLSLSSFLDLLGSEVDHRISESLVSDPSLPLILESIIHGEACASVFYIAEGFNPSAFEISSSFCHRISFDNSWISSLLQGDPIMCRLAGFACLRLLSFLSDPRADKCTGS